MREILFKAKRKDNGEWVEGTPIYLSNGAVLMFLIGKTIWETQEINPETVCQYTELDDKNGKKIFEGDITKYPWRFSHIIDMCVVFENGEFRLSPLRAYSFATWNIRICDENLKLEVIGNIYDKRNENDGNII